MFRRKRVAELMLLTAAVLVALLLLEAGLRLFTDFPVTTESNRIKHPQLGYTLSSDLNDVDERGFRNTTRTLEESDLVIIGDSHAYGVNVAIEENFPSIVASKTQRRVYNFGVGSYGIYQYRVLIEKAAEFPIQDVLLAFYPANDLSVSCDAVRTDYWKRYVKENELELPGCIEISWDRLSIDSIWRRLARVLGQTATIQVITYVLPEGFHRRILSGKSVNSATHFVFEGNQSVRKSHVLRHSENTSLENSVIRMNFRNSKAFLLDARNLLADASIGFVVLIIPSKELVMYEWMARRGGERSEEFESLLQNELSLVRDYEKFLDDNNIAFLSALPHLAEALLRAMKNGELFYKPDDGHPAEFGYEAYADVAIKALVLLRETDSVQ